MKKLALFLGRCRENINGMSEIVLRRRTNIPADGNAVSVLIPNPDDLSVGGNLLYLLVKLLVFVLSLSHS